MELQQNRMMEHQQNCVVNDREKHEEALLALVQHSSLEVKNLRYYFNHYTNQLEEAEKKLQESKSKLAILRGQTSASSSDVEAKRMKMEHGSKNGPFDKSDGSSKKDIIQSKSHLLALNSKNYSHSLSLPHCPPPSMIKCNKSQGVQGNTEIKNRGSKRKFGMNEHEELVPLICKRSSPGSVVCETSSNFPSQHRKRVRCIAVCPVEDKRFVTSALDGVVNLWELHSSGLRASLLRTTDCASPMQRRWPEDIAWHPQGNSLVSVYSADSQDSQVSVTDMSQVQRQEEKADVNFLNNKPHVKGVINSIVFSPWKNSSFVTGGTDHAVILWNENSDNKWKVEPLHTDFHSSAVMGVAVMQQKQIVLSAGKDKKIFGYDAHVQRQDFKHQVDSKCLSVLPNPCDFNLFMVQTGTPERQLRLFDIRSKRTELHAFGWKQENSESQSALINQAWSPNGLYITSGSADPMIHIFDIRYNGRKPSHSIEAHQKRVFRAMWLHSVPILISISSDLNIGLHKVV